MKNKIRTTVNALFVRQHELRMLKDLGRLTRKQRVEFVENGRQVRRLTLKLA